MTGDELVLIVSDRIVTLPLWVKWKQREKRKEVTMAGDRLQLKTRPVSQGLSASSGKHSRSEHWSGALIQLEIKMPFFPNCHKT